MGREVSAPDVQSLTCEERQSLPATEHRPVFSGLGKPHVWRCAVCWDAEVPSIEAWPCEALRRASWQDNVQLAESLGLEWSA